MDKNNVKINSIRKLIDKYFSLQWCRENLVVPVSLEPALPPSDGVLTIAVANIVFLGTIGQTIKERLRNTSYSFKYIELDSEEIQEILDLAVEERFISGAQVDISEFSVDEVLKALQESSDIEDEDEFSLEFDSFEEEVPESEIVDITDEMLNSKTQRAAGIILINACKNGFSDIHIEPKEENYKIRVRKMVFYKNTLRSHNCR